LAAENCAAQHTAQAVLAVGLRQKALRQRFLIATTASRVFPQPIHIRVYSRSSAVKTGSNPWSKTLPAGAGGIFS
jgi:hypothetical protein